MKWQDIFVKARLIVRKKGPYYRNTLLSLAPYETPLVKSIGVTKGLVLVFNPLFVEKQTPEACAGVFVHEIHHIARKHHKRIELATQSLKSVPNIKYIANIAADIAINPNVLDEGWELPKDRVMPEDYGLPTGLLFEEYLRRLLAMGEELEQNPKWQEQKKNQGQDDQGQGNSPSPQGSLTAGQCGGVGGNGFGGIEDQADAEAGRSKSEVESIATNQAKEIEKVYASLGRGSCPKDITESIELSGKSKMPYYRLLGRYLQDAVTSASRGMEGFSRKLPSRKSFVTGVVRAGMIEGIPDVVIIFDTSGSMGTQQLSNCLRETVGVLHSCDITEVWLLQADAAVAAKPQRVRVRDLRKLVIHGRGGTSFTPALMAIEKLRPKPPVAIYFTDGDGSATYRPKGIDVIWAVVASHWSRKPDATFGKVVFLPD